MLHKIQHARSGGVLHGARPGWLSSFYLHSSLGLVGYCLHVVVHASEILKYVLRLGYGDASLHEQVEALNPSVVYFK